VKHVIITLLAQPSGNQITRSVLPYASLIVMLFNKNFAVNPLFFENLDTFWSFPRGCSLKDEQNGVESSTTST
jgi:hypothetical protein